MKSGIRALVWRLFLSLVLLSIPGCRGMRPALLVYGDSLWYRFLEGSGFFEKRLQEICGEHGLVVSVHTAQDGSYLDAEEAFSSANTCIVLLSPQAREKAPAWARSHPEKLFILPAEPEVEPSAPNLCIVYFDRTAAYREAGNKAARYLESAYPASSRQEEALAGILGFEGLSAPMHEMESFREGFAEVEPADLLVTRVLTDPYDRGGLKKALEGMEDMGVVLFLLKVYPSNSYALDLLSRKNLLAIVDDTAQGYEEVVAFAIREDLVGAVERALGGWRRDVVKWRENRIAGEIELDFSAIKEVQGF